MSALLNENVTKVTVLQSLCYVVYCWGFDFSSSVSVSVKYHISNTQFYIIDARLIAFGDWKIPEKCEKHLNQKLMSC